MAMNLLNSLIFATILVVFSESRVAIKCDLSLNQTISPRCGDVRVFGLTELHKRDILNAHKSKNFGPLIWSNELAARAQAWANKCDFFFKDPCIFYPGSQFKQMWAGKWSYYRRSFVIQSINSWCDLSLKSTIEMNSHIRTKCKPAKAENDSLVGCGMTRFGRCKNLSGDFTNMIGCGLIAIEDPTLRRVYNHFVCNYGPRPYCKG